MVLFVAGFGGCFLTVGLLFFRIFLFEIDKKRMSLFFNVIYKY